jgi:hypothetical protein
MQVSIMAALSPIDPNWRLSLKAWSVTIGLGLAINALLLKRIKLAGIESGKPKIGARITTDTALANV